MINHALLMASMICPNYTLINTTGSWTAQDQETLSYVINVGCAKQYPRSPCLKIFKKSDEGVYAVMCTQKIQK